MIAGSVEIAELEAVAPGAGLIVEGGVTYVYMPGLKLPDGCMPGEVEALLRPSSGPDGYTTRLFLSSSFPGKGQNWTTHRIAEKTWHAFSFNNVPEDIRLIEILANHLAVLR